MRITKVLLIGFAAVATPGLLGSGWIAWNAWQGLERAQAAEAVTGALRTSMQVQTLVAEETADLNTAALIRRGDARMQRQAANLTNQRIEAAIESAAAAGLALPDRGLIATLDALRQRVAASATGSGAPDIALSDAVLRTRRAVIADLERTSLDADHRLRELQPALMPLAQAAWQIMRARDEAGSRILLAYPPMLNPEAPIAPERLREFMQRTGLMTHAIASARHAAGDAGEYVAEAFRALDDGFLSMAEARFANYAAVMQARIAAIQAETGRTVEAIASIAQAIRELDVATTQVAAASEEQSAATREIGRAVAEAAAGTEDAARHAVGVRQGAERTGMAAADLRGASGDLAGQAEALRGRVEHFLADIRAA